MIDCQGLTLVMFPNRSCPVIESESIEANAVSDIEVKVLNWVLPGVYNKV